MSHIPHRSHWNSRWTFMLATAGSAIGLGNIWKLPYMIGVNGGSAFVLVFVISIFLVGIPLMMTEILLGRRAQKNPLDGIQTLAIEAKKSSLWRYLGGMGMLTGLLILGFYSVIGGWVLAYISEAVSGSFSQITALQSTANFDALLASPFKLLFWHTVFILMTMSVVAHGVNSGLEKANNILIPALFAILLVLLGYSMSEGDMQTAFQFMFKPDFSKITPVSVLSALGHAFFSLSLGMGAVMVYGSYLQRNVSIARTTIYIALADTLLGLLVGLAIYSLVFANHLAPNAGPGLIFQTLPIAFGHMPGGNIIGVLFFLLVAFAAWTSSISLVEPTIAWIVENTKIKRHAAALILGVAVWLLGVAVALSFNEWKDIKIVFNLNIFETLDKLTSTVLLPLGGLLMAIFAGYFMNKNHVQEELNLNDQAFKLWRIANNYIAPIAIAAVFLYLFGLIK
ncbi:MAG: sodium-dependent transporter [Methylotenera sp.]|uniref:sodium-dependent transporter n=1 Tax=Methylotenera sp. TaxID=2051956 RepID=UPI00271B6159|nr:sodium-dependent transporter [Methylotenera sp.]MDO9204279.1 sodium-dependent transporter [Methylotenera sp.]MDO9393740.1 sodium-dependent transporter [Methylotenera sp.]MDP1523142.1 sodium-dependent transporter [Methylotenera sp.]MDP2229958.1 sodium-dependent transporter [Methylotenera sp.]MDP3141563.1 sodium-dependent transporter [Methylotenera sp.]